ncbi:uncharacterized protein MYCFIDRAFT_180247 [Pseudocercospora fijiensis CIRAD86]|uniref:Uncharacterized protein n=1 Tax=Pseudocercospora fijiensis (strain CIRAD86) TaxID=383855 RepID=M3AHW0_PSEFD|nr:uncharacterized protein MYCFIDRAFT_180247 [Pseudocercospora fijiensis CIRAD86]EME77102.1 hypothetical protein MYCFIDRAFT_180247 [Pseudocercospora fijiensis CIRAD86]
MSLPTLCSSMSQLEYEMTCNLAHTKPTTTSYHTCHYGTQASRTGRAYRTSVGPPTQASPACSSEGWSMSSRTWTNSPSKYKHNYLSKMRERFNLSRWRSMKYCARNQCQGRAAATKGREYNGLTLAAKIPKSSSSFIRIYLQIQLQYFSSNTFEPPAVSTPTLLQQSKASTRSLRGVSEDWLVGFLGLRLERSRREFFLYTLISYDLSRVRRQIARWLFLVFFFFGVSLSLSDSAVVPKVLLTAAPSLVRIWVTIMKVGNKSGSVLDGEMFCKRKALVVLESKILAISYSLGGQARDVMHRVFQQSLGLHVLIGVFEDLVFAKNPGEETFLVVQLLGFVVGRIEPVESAEFVLQRIDDGLGGFVVENGWSYVESGSVLECRGMWNVEISYQFCRSGKFVMESGNEKRGILLFTQDTRYIGVMHTLAVALATAFASIIFTCDECMLGFGEEEEEIASLFRYASRWYPSRRLSVVLGGDHLRRRRRRRRRLLASRRCILEVEMDPAGSCQIDFVRAPHKPRWFPGVRAEFIISSLTSPFLFLDHHPHPPIASSTLHSFTHLPTLPQHLTSARCFMSTMPSPQTNLRTISSPCPSTPTRLQQEGLLISSLQTWPEISRARQIDVILDTKGPATTLLH